MRSAPFAFAPCLFWSAVALGQPAAPPPLDAGGLAPPPAVEGQGGSGGADGATPQGTDATLAEADREDSGRGLEFVWLNGEIGVQHLGLETFSGKDLVGPDVSRRKHTSLIAGAGLGARIVFLTVGARFRYGYTKQFKHFTVGAEGAVHFPFGALEPYAGLGVGYARVLEITHTAPGVGTDIDIVTTKMNPISGVDARLFGGVDYYLTNMFSVGANVSGDVLFLFRSGTEGADPAVDVYARDGKSIGAGVTATAVGGLHF
jgi:hypothetical protein